MLKSVIKISASWCQPCKVFAPIFHEVSKMDEYKDITFSEIDVDDDVNDIVEKFEIKSVPTTILLDEENNVLKKLIGSLSKNDFITILNSTISE